MKHSSGLGVKTTFRLAFSKKRIALKVVTVILSVIAFTLLAFGMLGYTFDYTEEYIKPGYLNYVKAEREKGIDYIRFEARYAGDDKLADYLTREQVGSVKEKTGRHFVCSAASDRSWTNYVGYGKNLIDENIPAEKGEASPKEIKYDFYGLSIGLSGFSGFQSVEGTEEDFRSMGYTLLAGRYPKDANEVVISEAHFSAFQGEDRGYYDVTSLYENGWDGDEPYYDELPQYKIEKYSDILGKRLGGGVHERDFYTIVGVADTNFDPDLAEERFWKGYPAGCFLRGIDPSNNEISYMYSREYDDELILRYIDLCMQWKEQAEEYRANPTYDEHGNLKSSYYPSLQGLSVFFPVGGDLISTDSFKIGFDTEAGMFAFMFGAPGVIFAVVAFVLYAYLVYQSALDKTREMGLLRSMGAREGSLYKIYLIGTVVISTAIFLVALALSLTVYYTAIAPWTTWDYGIRFAVYNGWTVLILAAASYIIPVLSTLLAMSIFFHNPIAANLSGEMRSPRRGRRIKK